MECLSNMDRIQITNTLMMQLFDLYENKGKALYYKDFFQRDDEVMAKQTIEDDVYALGEFLELKITPNRLRLLSSTKRNYVAKNKDETLLLNIKNVLNKIQSSAQNFSLSFNGAYELATVLFRNYENVRYKKLRPTTGKTNKEFHEMSSQGQLEMLIDLYNKVRRSKKHEIVVTIINFFVDFIKIEPFSNYNKEIGLMLVYTILAREFKVLRYESFFKELNNHKEKFDQALVQAYFDWEQGFSQTDPLVRVFVDVIQELNVKVKEKEHAYEFELGMNKTDSVVYIILHGPAIFSKKEIREKLPLVSDSTINKSLQNLKKEGVIRPLGKGRNSQWQRLVEPSTKFSPEQLTLFD